MWCRAPLEGCAPRQKDWYKERARGTSYRAVQADLNKAEVNEYHIVYVLEVDVLHRAKRPRLVEMEAATGEEEASGGQRDSAQADFISQLQCAEAEAVANEKQAAAAAAAAAEAAALAAGGEEGEAAAAAAAAEAVQQKAAEKASKALATAEKHLKKHDCLALRDGDAPYLSNSEGPVCPATLFCPHLSLPRSVGLSFPSLSCLPTPALLAGTLFLGSQQQGKSERRRAKSVASEEGWAMLDGECAATSRSASITSHLFSSSLQASTSVSTYPTIAASSTRLAAGSVASASSSSVSLAWPSPHLNLCPRPTTSTLPQSSRHTPPVQSITSRIIILSCRAGPLLITYACTAGKRAVPAKWTACAPLPIRSAGQRSRTSWAS